MHVWRAKIGVLWTSYVCGAIKTRANLDEPKRNEAWTTGKGRLPGTEATEASFQIE